MNKRDLKYLLAYVTPLSGFMSVAYGGFMSYFSVFFLFFIIPTLELIFPQYTDNIKEDEEPQRTKVRFFDFLLYLNLPILYALIAFLLYTINTVPLSNFEIIGMVLSVGIINGGLGINVAHEIGHRSGTFNQVVSQLLLLPNLYMHFNIEHNRGHHKWVSTPKDPATSRKNEIFYFFWFRTVIFGFLSAWNIEKTDRIKKGLSPYSLTNKMIQFVLIQLGALVGLYLLSNLFTVGIAIVVAILGFTMLELVNYIEHYGLVRKLLPNGRYESVQEHHSWNSNHEIGRVLLYELTRHSDHHFKSTRKYQVLRHFDTSPQLPYGYPGSMILALFPPIWFGIMNKQLEKQITA